MFCVERGNFNPVNFFSYFTVLTNIIVFVTFLISAIAVAHGKGKKVSALRSASTVYILVVGVGFSVLLSGLEGITLTAVPWDNTVLHYIIPIAVLIDYVFDRPVRTEFKKALLWLIYPAAYLVYALIRGGLTGWYPYPFLNPATNGVWATVAVIAGIVVLAVGLTWTIVHFGKKKKA